MSVQQAMARQVALLGLVPLVPLPFLDDYVRSRVLRAGFVALGEAGGAPIDAPAARVLSEDRSSMLRGCLYAAVVWPLRKLFRTVLVVLLLKDILDEMTLGAIRFEMGRIAVDRGLLPAAAPAVRDQMEASLERHRASPVSRLLLGLARPPVDWPRGLGVLVSLAGRLLWAGGGGAVLEQYSAALARLPGPGAAASPAATTSGPG